MRANLPAGTGPKPALHDGKQILHTHPSGGQVYLADDGTGWWKVEAMPAPTVQVPVSLIERLRYMAADHVAFTAAEWDASADALAALLSQPTPSAGTCICNTGPNTDGPDIDCPVHGLPPRIEDMAPGTTFRAHLRTSSVEEQFTKRTHSVMCEDGDKWHRDDVDPSTIRDVTPPAGT